MLQPNRFLAAFLAALLLSFPVGVLAAPPGGEPPAPGKEGAAGLPAMKVSREEAVAAARRVFPIPETLGEPNVNVHQSRDGAVWNLNWQTPGKKVERIGLAVGVDALTGEIRSYSRWSSGQENSAPLSYTRSQAFQTALAWRDKLAPAYSGSVRYFETPLGSIYYGSPNSSYQFRWDRLSEGYPVQNEGINLSINARTGELESFNLNWRQGGTFQSPAAVLGQSEAESIYRERVPLILQYQRFQKPGTDKGEWQLVYRPLTGYYPSISQEGALLHPQGGAVDVTSLQGMKPVPAPDKPYAGPPAKPLTREEALAMAQAVLGRVDEPTNSNYSEYGEQQKTRTWDFSWYRQGELREGETNANARVDAERGVVLSLGNWGNVQNMKADEQPKISEAKAQEIAVAFIRTYRPDLAGSLMMVPAPSDIMIKYKLSGMRPPNHNVSFVTVKNSIPIMDIRTTVDVDVRTGAIRNFGTGYPQFQQEEFPQPTGLISPVDAMNALLTYQGLELNWVTFWAPPSAKGMVEKPSEPQLVWVPRRGLPLAALSATTGAPLDHEGRDLIEAARRPIDIEGHFAQQEIELLWARRVFELKEGRFHPGQAASVSELARWLVLAKGMQPYMAYDFRGAFAGKGGGEAVATKLAAAEAAPYLGAALQSGILLPEDFGAEGALDAPVSREVFALWAVRAMGYGSIAKMANQIEMTFPDKAEVGPGYANAVAILQGLGIVRGDGRGFGPQRQISRGEAVKIIFAVASETRR